MNLASFAIRRPRTIPMTSTLIEAAKEMKDHGVDFVIVVDADGRTPVSLLTDRHIVELLASEVDPWGSMVVSYGTRPVRTLPVDETVEEVARKLVWTGADRLLLVDDRDRLVGSISRNDVLDWAGRGLAGETCWRPPATGVPAPESSGITWCDGDSRS